MKQSVKRIVALCICAVLISGCRQKQSQTEAQYTDKKIQIGFALDSKVMERWIRDINVFTTMAHKRGAVVDVQIANGNVKEQVEQIDKFINEKKDVIVVVATDCNSLTKVIGRAKDAGIKVICYDRLVANCSPDLFISFDCERIGEFMGETMAEKLPDGSKIVMVCGPGNNSNTAKINLGFKRKIKEKKFDIVEVYQSDDESTDYAFDCIGKALEEHPDIQGIMCGNDALASQVIRALAEKQLAGKVIVTGHNADIEACQKIVEGQQTMTVFEDFEEMAKLAAEYAIILAQGFPMDGVEMEKMGDYTVPAVYLEPVRITKENMEELIERGFHLKEDIYLNVKGE